MRPATAIELATLQLDAVLDVSANPTILTNERGIISRWNKAAEEFYGYSSDEAVGRPVAVMCAVDPTHDSDEELRRVCGGDTLRDVDTVHRRRDGVRVPVSLTIAPLRDASGTIVGTVRVTRNVTPDERAERAVRRLAAIVESSDDAIVSKDLNGIVTSWNIAAERMFGYTAAEMIGQSIRLLIPADRQNEEDIVLSQVRRGARVDHFDTIRRRKDGSTIPISLTVSPIRDDDGRIVGASKIARDITERREAEQERARLLAEAERHAVTTERLNHVGAIVAATLDRHEVVQAVTDAATELTTAAFGAFFYNAVDAKGEAYTLCTISGVPRDAFSKFPMPRNTKVFDPTFRGVRIVRSDDITRDPRYGHNPPYYGMPAGHLPVRSYLAVPVRHRTGEVIGGLFFGHPEPGRFTEQHERLVAGIASWAAIGLENAQLYVGVQEASRLKDEFLATLSHELRTPLNAILGYARMVKSGIVSPERMMKAVDTIERNATSLTQIVEDVLDVSRIIAGKMRLNVQPVQLPRIIQGSVEAFAPAADAKGLRIETDLDPHPPSVSGDPERLQQVIWNLISNAVKFTDRGGTIRVVLESTDRELTLTVRDTGVGIDPAFLPHIFERFRQADGGTTRERGGLGLGLGIARQLVEMHGGTIQATSAGIGTGATFVIRLPSAAAAAESDQRSSTGEQAARAVFGATAEVADLHGVRILAVDDEPDALALISEILESAGARVSVAHSATEALGAIQLERPDALIADLGMPRIDGFELIARIRQSSDPAIQRIPAAALTAYARSEDRVRAIRSGFQIHLAKPIDPSVLLDAIARLVGGDSTNPR
jgi:PAS domain S-box-containing protein